MYFYQIAAAADTVLMRQVPPVRTAFEQIVFVASGLTSILTLLLVLGILLMLLGMRSAAKALHGKLDEVLLELRPLTQNANAASADVRQAVAMTKSMVEESRETVTLINLQVRDSVTELTDRVNELTEMVAKVSRAATRVAGVATTAIGGLKAGVRIFGLGKDKVFGWGRKKKARFTRDLDIAERDERPRLRRRR